MIKFRKIPLGLLILRKKKGKLNFMDLGGWADRNRLMIKILKESLSEDIVRDFSPVIINTGDRPIDKIVRLNIFSFTTADGYYDKIIPDYLYDSWMECKIPEFDKITKDIEHAGDLKPKIDKIGWIGNINTSPSRLKLLRLGEKYPHYLDIMDSNSVQYISLPDLVKNYKYLIDVEGNGYSGRLKYLFFSGRPVFVQERVWGEYALLGAIPYKHYIPVKNDFSDLIEKIEKYFDSDLVTNIGKNGQDFAIENLNKEKAYEYIYNEFVNLKKNKFNTVKIILFVVFIFTNALTTRLVNLVREILRI